MPRNSRERFRLWKAPLSAVLFCLCTACGVSEDEAGPWSQTNLPMPERNAFALVPFKPAVDQPAQIAVVGHPGKGNPEHLLRRDENGIWRNEVLEWGEANDRHDCAAADFNGDGLSDFFCAAGGGRGEKAGNPNQLWLQNSEGNFDRVEGAWGAELASLRGRLALVVNANRDSRPDVLITVWGEREDEQLNESVLLLNMGERFAIKPLQTGRVGGRCAAARDINNDGVDDLLLCGEGGGGVLLISRGGAFTDLQLPKMWINDLSWRTVTDATVDTPDNARAGFWVLTPKKILKFGLNVDNHRNWFLSRAGSITLPVLPTDPEEGGNAESMVVTDLNHDGASDVFVSRSFGESGSDYLITGPDYDVPTPAPHLAGKPYSLQVFEEGILRSYAGADWSGLADLLRYRHDTESVE